MALTSNGNLTFFDESSNLSHQQDPSLPSRINSGVQCSSSNGQPVQDASSNIEFEENDLFQCGKYDTQYFGQYCGQCFGQKSLFPKRNKVIALVNIKN